MTEGKMMKDIKGLVVLDASVLIDLLMLTSRGLFIRQLLLDNKIDARATELAIIETEFILGRKIGWENAIKKVQKLLDSNFVVIERNHQLAKFAALYKCNRSISLPDCMTLALAKSLATIALFSTKENEIKEEMVKEPFDVPMIFIEEYITE